MTRKKVNFAYISNDSARKATFKKRKKGLLKKMSELSTLCAIQTCAIIYSPYDPEPEVWPSPLGAQSVVARFKNMPEAEQSRKMMNQGSFLRQRITKFEEQVKKQQRENREREMTQVMYKSLVGNQGLQNLGVVDLNDLGWVIEKTIDAIDERIKSLREQIMPPPQVVTAGTSSGHDVYPTNQENYGDATKNIADMAMDVYTPNQQFMSMVPDVGYGLRNEDMAISQNPQWLVELLRTNENVGFGKNEDHKLPFSYNSNNSTLWSTFEHFP
ncbi:agamous-like MADS-box protein AGL80 [Juglans microcarpa x Juglans regia]|uniref:agamous-like MADS-box protein AGL80 n=1 Tax=Juglans microcarpa x Juglans regia TaxID=2249226 RepID=UPI001B7EE96C|nr:agamous-like MADS-box protein AGL80 [Juglans microcarpa x Juglans regia]